MTDTQNKKYRDKVFNKLINEVNECKNTSLVNNIEGILYFIDSNYKKNKKYYLNRIDEMNNNDITIRLFYEEEFFNILKDGKKALEEYIDNFRSYLQIKKEMTSILLDFDNSELMYKALLNLPDKYFKLLISNNKLYDELRKELFDNFFNLNKARKSRNI